MNLAKVFIPRENRQRGFFHEEAKGIRSALIRPFPSVMPARGHGAHFQRTDLTFISICPLASHRRLSQGLRESAEITPSPTGIIYRAIIGLGRLNSSGQDTSLPPSDYQLWLGAVQLNVPSPAQPPRPSSCRSL